MTMPRDLYLVRHGQSLGNIALEDVEFDREADSVKLASSLDASEWPLTSAGQREAEAAGAWFKTQGIRQMGLYFCSDYRRAMQTAGHLGFDDADWQVEFYLRERERGHEGDLLPRTEREQLRKTSQAWKDRHSFYWRPEHGESIADVCQRVHRVLDKLYRDSGDGPAIIVSHEETLWAIRVRLERLTPADYLRFDDKNQPELKDRHKIHNCQILHYTRRDPQTDQLAEHFTHLRVIDPVVPQRSRDWAPIERRRYTNHELLNGRGQ